MFRKIGTTLAAGALALTGLVAVSAPAQAAQIQCPSPGFLWNALDQAKARGQVVDEYWVGSHTGVVVYKIDNRYEVFTGDILTGSRICHDRKPERPADARDTLNPKKATGGGGAGIHAPGYGGWGINLYPMPTPNKGKVTVGPVENVS